MRPMSQSCFYNFIQKCPNAATGGRCCREVGVDTPTPSDKPSCSQWKFLIAPVRLERMKLKLHVKHCSLEHKCQVNSVNCSDACCIQVTLKLNI